LAIHVSVIIAAHNAAAYVASAVRSALDQTLRELEVILIDDAATDDTAFVALSAAKEDRRFSVLRCLSNGGPSAARNLGLDHAMGKWIAPLDADDTFSPNRLESMLQLAEAHDADLLADNISVSRAPGFVAGSPVLPHSFMTKAGRVSAAEFVARDRPGYGLKSVGFMKPLMRSDFLRSQRIQYDPRLRNGEDFHLYMRCLLLGARLHVTPQAWYQYLYRSDSQTRGIEARYPSQLIAANENLEQVALECGDINALIELRKRRQDINRWIPYVSFVGALREKQAYQAMKRFYSLPSHTYALQRLLQAGLRRACRTTS